jgi:hypothetical protein
MKTMEKQGKVKGETYDYCMDFMVLSAIEKHVILKTARTLLKQQRENDAQYSDAILQNEGKR